MNCIKMTMVVILIATLMLAGCSANRISLAEKGLVSVEKQDSEKVKILWTDVYEQDGQTWVYGVLKQRGYTSSSTKTHVDIQILDTDGLVHYEVISKDMYVPQNRIGKGIDWKRFRVQLPDALPKDSQIKMTVHGGSHEKSDVKS